MNKQEYYLKLLEINHQLVNIQSTTLKVSLHNNFTNVLIKAFYKLNSALTYSEFTNQIISELTQDTAHKNYLINYFPEIFEKNKGE